MQTGIFIHYRKKQTKKINLKVFSLNFFHDKIKKITIRERSRNFVHHCVLLFATLCSRTKERFLYHRGRLCTICETNGQKNAIAKTNTAIKTIAIKKPATKTMAIKNRLQKRNQFVQIFDNYLLY